RLKCARGGQFGPHHLRHAAAAPFCDIFGHLQPADAGFIGVGESTRVEQHERPQAIRVFSNELPGDVAAHREAGEYDGLVGAELQYSQEFRQIVGVSFHSDAVSWIDRTQWRLAESAEIWRDYARVGAERFNLRVPH